MNGKPGETRALSRAWLWGEGRTEMLWGQEGQDRVAEGSSHICTLPSSSEAALSKQLLRLWDDVSPLKRKA